MLAGLEDSDTGAGARRRAGRRWPRPSVERASRLDGHDAQVDRHAARDPGVAVWQDWPSDETLPCAARAAANLPGVTGTARLDRRTRRLVKRIRPGDIAVIDHVDIDRGAAEALVEAGVAAVVNIAPSISGRYPNLGPELSSTPASCWSTTSAPRSSRPSTTATRSGSTATRIYRGDDAGRDPAYGRRAESVAAGDGGVQGRHGEPARGVQRQRGRAPAARAAGCCSTARACPSVTTPIEGRQVVVVLRRVRLRQRPRPR